MRISQPLLALLSFVLAFACASSTCSASSITYDVNQTIGAGSVTGFITTDGTTGVLNTGANNILNWNLLWNDGTTTFDLLGSNSVFENNTTVLSATATQLLFNFSGSGFFYFVNTTPAFPQHVVSFQSAPDTITPGLGAGEQLAYFNGTNDNNPTPQFTAMTGTQVIGTAVSATPLPASWTMMLGGLAIFGFIAHQRSKQGGASHVIAASAIG